MVFVGKEGNRFAPVLPKDDHSSIVPLANALVERGLAKVWVTPRRWRRAAFENCRVILKTKGLEFGKLRAAIKRGLTF